MAPPGRPWAAPPGRPTRRVPFTATTYFRRQASAVGTCGPVVSNVVTITVLPGLTAGTIGSDQAMCPGATPAPLTSTAPAMGGTGTFAYQWDSSGNNSDWAPIPGATGADLRPGSHDFDHFLPPPGDLGRLRADTFTPSVVVTVLPALSAGSIAANQTICAGAHSGGAHQHRRGRGRHGHVRLPVGVLGR